MSLGRFATYGAFGAAIIGVGILGFSTEHSSGPKKTSGADTELGLPNMEDVNSGSAQLATADKQAIRDEIRAYILEEPELILEAFRLLEEKRVVEEAQSDVDLVRSNADDLFNDGYSYVGGNPEGSITMVEFQDYRCGFCKRAHGEVQELVAEDGDIRLVVKEFPILGPDSMLTSELAIATLMTQGDAAYKRISDAFMTYAGPVNDEALDRISRGALVDIEASRAALDDPEVQKRIASTRDLGRRLNISGTPTFVIGEKVIRGYLPKEQMAEVVELSRRVTE